MWWNWILWITSKYEDSVVRCDHNPSSIGYKLYVESIFRTDEYDPLDGIYIN